MQRRHISLLLAFACTIASSSNAWGDNAKQATALPLFIVQYEVSFGKKKLLEIDIDAKLIADRLTLAGEFKGSGVLGALFGSTGTIQAQNLWQAQQKQIIPLNFTQQYTNAAKRNIFYQFEVENFSATAQLGEEQHHFVVGPEIHSVISMHLQLSIDAQQGKMMMYYDTLSKIKLRRYVFFNRGEEVIPTAFGNISTVRFDRLKRGKLDYRYWLSPQHAYLPIKAERIHDSRVQYSALATNISVQNSLLP